MPCALWTPHAERELVDIIFHISVRDHRPDAQRHVHPVAPPGWFYARHKRWLVFYQLHPEGIEVMRVIDGSRDLPSLMP